MTLQVAFVNAPTTKEDYDSLYVGSDAETELASRRRHIYSSTYHSRCQAEKNETRYNNSLAWFNLMTRYLAVLKTVRANLSSETIRQLNILVQQTHGQVVSLSVCLSSVRPSVCLSVACRSVSYTQRLLVNTARTASSLWPQSRRINQDLNVILYYVNHFCNVYSL